MVSVKEKLQDDWQTASILKRNRTLAEIRHKSRTSMENLKNPPIDVKRRNYLFKEKRNFIKPGEVGKWGDSVYLARDVTAPNPNNVVLPSLDPVIFR